MIKRWTLLIAVGLILFSCSTESDNIVGKWQAINYDCKGVRIDNGASVSSFDLILSFNYEFNEDGTLIFNNLLESDVEGTWEIKDDLIILTTGKKESVSSYNFKFDGPDKLIMADKQGKAKLTFQRQ
jgi:hypothetical protein